MKKFIAYIFVLISFSFCTIANADVMEDVQKSYPKLEINTTVFQDSVGAEKEKKSLVIHRTDNYGVDLTIRLVTLDNKNTVCLDYTYSGKSWIFMKNASAGDGKELIVLEPSFKPSRKVSGRWVYEYFMCQPTIDDLKFLKNTKVMRVHSAQGPHTIQYTTTEKHHVPYFEALDYAIKFLEENNQ